LKNVLSIAVNVIKDAARKKVFYVVFLFGLAIVALSPLLPTFDLGARAQFLRDISLSLTSLFGVVLAVILSVSQIPGEVERRTIYNILSKPVSRLQYLVGKYLGIMVSIAAILLVMGLEIVLLIFIRLHVFTPLIFEGVFAVFLECAVIAAFCVMLSTFATVPVNAFAAVLFYLVCHVKTGFLHQKLVEGAFGVGKVFTWALYYVIPNLEDFNLSQPVGYGGGAGAAYMLRLTAYALLFVVIFMVAAYLVFRSKDL
jgi:ABC-type transport system involved in multi-copper enzyme maturation permease subunit